MRPQGNEIGALCILLIMMISYRTAKQAANAQLVILVKLAIAYGYLPDPLL